MKAIKEILVENLINLRKSHKLTQLELAERVGYSDKAVSRWEHGEVLPDIETLEKIASVYDIPVSMLITEHSNIETESKKVHQGGNKLIISLLSVITVFFIATFVFTALKIILDVNYWQVFVLAVPISAILGIVFSALWAKGNRRKFISIFVSILIWSFLAFGYLQLLEYNLWPIFLLGAPLQVAVILSTKIKKDN